MNGVRAVLLVLLASTAGAGCLGPVEVDEPCPCDERGSCLAMSGEATLLARATHDDYEAATFSFEHASREDLGLVRNDWDLLYGNDGEDDRDLFAVNTVVDDRSFIVDLGAVPLSTVPEVVRPDDFEPGAFGDHDYVPVVLHHLYVIRTLDTETRQYAAVRVIEHEVDDRVTILWYRSAEPDRFVPRAVER